MNSQDGMILKEVFIYYTELFETEKDIVGSSEMGPEQNPFTHIPVFTHP